MTRAKFRKRFEALLNRYIVQGQPSAGEVDWEGFIEDRSDLMVEALLDMNWLNEPEPLSDGRELSMKV